MWYVGDYQGQSGEGLRGAYQNKPYSTHAVSLIWKIANNYGSGHTVTASHIKVIALVECG
jgi:beta-lactamase class A